MNRSFLGTVASIVLFGLCATASAQSTTTTVNSNLTNVPYGPLPVNLSITSPSGTPSGLIIYNVDSGTPQFGQTVDASGNATVTLPKMNVGNHSVEFDFQGDSGYSNSSVTVPVSVVPNSIGIAISADTNSVSYGSGPIVHVVISGGPHNGNLTYWADGNELISLDPFTQFSAIYPSTTIPAGAHNLYVRFDSDDGNTTSSMSNTVPLNVALGTPQVFLNAQPNPAQTGNPVRFNALIEPQASVAGAPPTGSVDFTEGAIDYGTTPIIVNGFGTAFCSLDVPSLPGGVHVITANYSGDTNYAPGSITWTETVNPINQPTATALSTDHSTYVYNQPIQVSANVTSSSGTPTGTVNVYQGPSLVSAITLANGSGIGVVSPGFAAGAYTLNGNYLPTDNFVQSSSSGLPITVNKATPSLQVTGPVQVNAGQASTFTAAVVGPYGGGAGGTVTVLDGVQSHGPFAVTGASAACSITLSSGVSHTLVFQYSGDSNFNSALNSAGVTVLFNQPPVISGIPANITVDATSAAGAVVTYATPTATDLADGTDLVLCSPSSSSTFPIGLTTVYCTSTDSQGNRASVSFAVNVLPPSQVNQGVLASLAGITMPSANQQHVLDDAKQHLAASTVSSLWVSATMPTLKAADTIYDDWSAAVADLYNLVGGMPKTALGTTLQQAMIRTTNMARLSALFSMAAPKSAQNLSDARNEFAQGDASLSTGKYQEAVNHYKNAWKHAQGI